MRRDIPRTRCSPASQALYSQDRQNEGTARIEVERIMFVGLEMSESGFRIAHTQNGKEARIHSDGYSAADGLSECARANGAVTFKTEGCSKDWTGNLGRRSQHVETAIP